MSLDAIYTGLKESAQNSRVARTIVEFGAISLPVIAFGRVFSLMSPMTGAFYAAVQLGAMEAIPKLFRTSEKVARAWTLNQIIIRKIVIPSCMSYAVVVILFSSVSLVFLAIVPITSILALEAVRLALSQTAYQTDARFIRNFLSKTLYMNGYNGKGRIYGAALATALVEYEKNKDLDQVIRKDHPELTVRQVFEDLVNLDGRFQGYITFYKEKTSEVDQMSFDQIEFLIQAIQFILDNVMSIDEGKIDFLRN